MWADKGERDLINISIQRVLNILGGDKDSGNTTWQLKNISAAQLVVLSIKLFKTTFLG